MRLLIYGSGAVGLGIGSFLLKAGTNVDFLARPGTVERMRADGIHRDGIFGEHHAPGSQFGIFSRLDDVTVGDYDFVLVTTKSFDTHFAAKDLKAHTHLFNNRTRIILCQNGWGNTEIFSPYFAKDQLYNARVITGFIRPAPNRVTVTVHADSVRVGSLFHAEMRPIDDFCRAVSLGGLPCCPSEDVAKDLWSKMIYNCMLNPLGAIFALSYGRLGEIPAARTVMERVLEEAYAVMHKAGFSTRWATIRQYREAFYRQLLPATAGHFPSMLQDIRAGKPTEIDALCGVIAKLAGDYDLKAPANTAMLRMIRFLEENASQTFSPASDPTAT